MFCGKCGNQVEPDVPFCNVRGEKLLNLKILKN